MSEARRIVTLEVPEAWFANPADGSRHHHFYASLLAALAELDVLVKPIWLPRGAERASRPSRPGDFTLSFHSYGPDTGKILRCKESYIPPFYTMDRMGYSCFSELACHPARFAAMIAAQDTARATAFVTELAQELRSTNLSKYPQPPRIAAPAPATPQGSIFVPLQMRQDSVAAGEWIKPLEALEIVIATATARNQQVVIKRHPRCRDAEVTARLAAWETQSGVTISNASVHALIAAADLVVGGNSGVLFEALVQNKPVISYAASDFGQATQQVRSQTELARSVISPEVPDAATRSRFLFWYLTHYCVRADDAPAIRRRVQQALRTATLGSTTQRSVWSYRWGLYGWSLFDRVKRRLF